MADPIELRLATSNSFPTGTGSFSYRGEYELVVKDLAFQKQVSVRGHRAGSSSWNDHFASYQESLPDGRELWKLTTADELVEFAVSYGVQGALHWDNNAGRNYRQPQVFDEFDALLGLVPAIVLGARSFSDATHVRVLAALKNLAFVKDVGVVYTTNGWASGHVAACSFQRTLKSGNEVWEATFAVGSATRVEFALFLRVNGQEFWDNNFARNYVLTRA
jgi:Starch/carbohydrate-binding module (family 53)/Carbohydrate/starch-binding module (family 21)